MNERLLGLVDGVRLTPTQRRLAQCLLDRPGTGALMSSAELAALAGVSQPSVTRFAVALGFDGYPALRRALRDGAPADPSTGTVDNELQRALHGEMATLSRLADRLADGTPERTTVAQAGKLLAASRPLPVLGLRAARPLADYFAYFAAKVHPDVRVLDQGGSLLADRIEQARAAGAGALLAIVLPRYPREALDALREARAAGLTTVVLTDSPVSPAAALADLPLTAAVGQRLVFDLHAAPMALTMVLVQAMCDADPAASQARLEDFEASAARRGVFVA
jgi:DNA-binding MurR/RpiR family transcriptional regulator